MFYRTGDFPSDYFAIIKDQLDQGVAFALSTFHLNEGGRFQRAWVEVMATIPGTGELRVVNDSDTGSWMAKFERIVGLLDIYEPSLPSNLRDQVVVSPRNMTKTGSEGAKPIKIDLTLCCGAKFKLCCMDLGILVSCLGVMFGGVVDPNSVFIGGVSGTGMICSGYAAIPPPRVSDVHMMRRDGIRRLYLGQPVDEDQYPLNELSGAATTDLGPGAPPLTIIFIGDLRDLFDRIPEGPECIFSNQVNHL